MRAAGVSAIVLDPNNDLARLGDAWPEPPPDWRPGRRRDGAGDYLADTDVRGVDAAAGVGPPAELPAAARLRAACATTRTSSTPAIEAAVASLAPRAKVDGRDRQGPAGSRRAAQGRLSHYAPTRRQRACAGSIDLLADLPDGRQPDLDERSKIAARDRPQSLTAAMVNDPLFGGDGQPRRPGALLTPAAGQAGPDLGDQLRRAALRRAAAELRQPAADGALRLDQAAPGGRPAARRPARDGRGADARPLRRDDRVHRRARWRWRRRPASTASGLVFATQAPKGLHNRIPGNAATQFFGLLNSPTQIDAAREMARAKGGDVADIGPPHHR